MRHSLPFVLALLAALPLLAIDHPGITGKDLRKDRLTLVRDGKPAVSIVVDDNADSAVKIAAANLAKDFERVTGTACGLRGAQSLPVGSARRADRAIHVAVVPNGKRETYVMTVTKEGIDIVGSDRRGAVYGIYELSEQIGVSPWYDWADAPLAYDHPKTLAITVGTYTNGEPGVRYRGLFLNDEAPCLTGWVKNTYGTDFGDHRFYARVGELILRLRGNFLWPAMWCWAFYADDPLNSKTMDEMGVIMGTSHHEPMARNHQEWARHRKENGAWNYATNQAVLDKFFTEGVERSKNTEDVITIGMRGDGDEAMGEGTDLALMKKIIENQRAEIEKAYGKPAAEVPQVWALYKEVQDYYDAGLRAPDDVTYLLCDDNWGNVRRLPNAEERKHPGGWGLYYHVDYVGAPRNSKWLNVTSAASMWEQMSLAYDYGVDRLWILNVGDLKPMEYPIQLFLDMAWNPTKFTAKNLHDHMVRFCSVVDPRLGRAATPSPPLSRAIADILDTSYRYAARVTPEMLDRCTYDLASGEWQKVRDDYAALAERARALATKLPPAAQDWYREIVLFHVEAMANLYEMYYAAALGDQARTEAAFKRDAELCRAYNTEIAGGKWNGFMKQKHIGYTSWNDNFPTDTCPEVNVDAMVPIASGSNTVGADVPAARVDQAVFDADAYSSATADAPYRWVFIPGLGRTKGAMEVFPRLDAPKNAKLVYKVDIPEGVTQAKVRVVVRSTLAFARKEGHRYRISVEQASSPAQQRNCKFPLTEEAGTPPQRALTTREINFNARLNEDNANRYSIFYPTIARRIVSNDVELPVQGGATNEIVLEPLDPGVAFERVIVDWSGQPIRGYLNGDTPKYAPKPKPLLSGELAKKEPYISSIERKKSYDKNMGENWWERRHAAILKKIVDEGAPTYDLVLAGDSITHRWERHGKDAYVAITNDLKVLNLGFGADCVRNLLWRLRSGELDGYKARVVQLMIGTNNGCAPSETAAEIRACLREIRQRQPQAKIVLCAILPRGNPDAVERGRNEAVNELIRPLSDGKTIVWQDWAKLFTLPDGRMNPDRTDDGLHPNAKGYAAWRDAALPFWKKLLK